MVALTLNHPSSRGRLVCLTVVLALLLPFVLAVALYVSGWRPLRTTIHGELITPPIALRPPSSAGTWPTGKWSLVLLADAPCREACQRDLDGLRRVRVALGKNHGRTLVLWWGKGTAIAAKSIIAQQPDLGIVDGAVAGLPSALAGTAVAVVDPEGRAVLRYRTPLPLNGMLADLERLLKSSWIG